jgi:hypothetical protein
MPQQELWTQDLGRLEMLVIAILLFMFAGTVAAEHEADHRYDVRGYVLDAEKNSRAGVPVTILMGEQIIGSGRTDSEGYYSIRLHLHDSDIGRPLVVRAGNAQAEIRMQANPGDKATTRLHHLNFVGSDVVEEELSAGPVPTWAYIAAAPLVLWGIVYVGGATRRRIRRAKSAHAKKSKGKRRAQ